jgi:RHS repeat-associated protein
VWDSNYKGVWHLPNGTTLSATDSTNNANNGTLDYAPVAGSGHIDGAASLTSASFQDINFGAGGSLNPAAVTLSAWVKAASFPGPYQAVINKRGASGYHQILVRSDGKLALYVLGANGGSQYDGSGTNTLSAGTWYYLTLTYDSATGLTGYVNGAVDGSGGAQGNLASNSGSTYIGFDGGRWWNGAIDEVRVSSAARSAGWIATEYNNQSSPATFYTVGGAQSQGGSGGGPVYLTNYTYDMLGHLTQVSMPRGATTQTRTFNYTSGNSVGAHLLSATNPENGTVSYTYSNHLLATKTDAAGNQFTYAYDSLHRLQTVSANGNVLRTYTYDANTIDASYSQNVLGRLATVTYPVINYDGDPSGLQGSTTFTDMFSYKPAGAIIGKRLRVTKTNTYLQFGMQHTQTAVGDLNLAYAYNNEGKPTSVTYPTDVNNNTPSYNYSYDAMMRPQGMTDQSSNSVVSNVQYGAANQLLQMTYAGGTETRTYNNMLQLTNITGLGQNITYTFPSANNGKIQSQILNGENISYVYDSLNRLTSASGDSGGGWGQAYTYDGFGNLTARTGTGAAQSTTITTPADPTTNRLSGYGYDANGNQLSVGYHYDAENRLVQANMPGGTMHYGYDGQNKRIWQGTFTTQSDPQYLTSDTVSLFGVDGRLIGTYAPFADWNNTQNQIAVTFSVSQTRVYFGGKLIKWVDVGTNSHYAVQDRLGSLGKYYPYGEERNSPPLYNDQVKFATYTRDSATGNDYADQRYYTSTLGRFMSPDPYSASGGPNNPKSWNRYSYASGDPANGNDPSGRLTCTLDGIGTDCGSVCQGFLDGVYLMSDGSGSGDIGIGPTMCGGIGIGGPIEVGGGDDGGGSDEPPPPNCTITLFSRPTPRQLGGPANHTYIRITDPAAGIDEVLEGEPTQKPKIPNPFGGNWGNLRGRIDQIILGVLIDPIKGTTLNPNNIVASLTGGSTVCDDVIQMDGNVKAYNSGPGSPYRPVPRQGSGYVNSNSFTFTLLFDVGLNNPNWRPSGWSPGWGIFVPGL